MATQKDTCALRAHETLLSKRIFTGSTRPQFRSSSSRWSDDSSNETRLVFDVTWDGPPSPFERLRRLQCAGATEQRTSGW